MRLLLLLLASPSLALSPAAERGRAVMRDAQCTRCHEVSGADGLPAAQREMHCVDCHTWILGTKGDAGAIAKQRETFPDWDRYLENIVHFVQLPDLGTLTRRVDPAFVRAFLDAPRDLRPHLDETMIPLRMTAAQKDAVVAYLAELGGGVRAGAAKVSPVPAERAKAGEQRFVALGCPTCHLFDGRSMLGADPAFYKAMGERTLLAPDLRHARERIPREVLVRFVQDPAGVDPKSRMPKQLVGAEDAEKLADFLLGAPLGAATTTANPRASNVGPVLPREVTYDEVADEVLGMICVHCHMDPASNNGDGGAGNTGGLGYAGLKLSLESYASIRRGFVRDGKAVSLLKPERPGEEPPLLASLLRRHAEGNGPQDVDRPGMPLGLPPLAPKQISLVRTWLAQGAPE